MHIDHLIVRPMLGAALAHIAKVLMQSPLIVRLHGIGFRHHTEITLKVHETDGPVKVEIHFFGIEKMKYAQVVFAEAHVVEAVH